MGLQAQMAEKFAECLGSHPSFEAKHQPRGHDQADQPVAAGLCFPQRHLRVAVAALNRLEVTIHTACGKSGTLRKAPDALLPVWTNCIADEHAFGLPSHGV